MPEISTTFGLAQALGIGFGLLLFIAIRSRRYATDVAKSYIPLWLACCVGLAVYSSVEAGMASATLASRMLPIVIIPTLAALTLRVIIRAKV